MQKAIEANVSFSFSFMDLLRGIIYEYKLFMLYMKLGAL